MDSERLERVLIGIARQYAPPLFPFGWEKPGDLMRLKGKTLPDYARSLASYGALALFADLPPSLHAKAALYLQDWADQWVRLHTLFCDALFPTFRQVSAYFLDQALPRAALFFAAASPVSLALAQIAAPFVNDAHGKPCPEAPILDTVIGGVIDRLEAADAPLPLRERLTAQGVVLLRILIESQVRTISPIPYVPGQTIPERLPGSEPLKPVAHCDGDSDEVSMTVSPGDQTTTPLTLPEIDAPAATIKPDSRPPLPPIPGIERTGDPPRRPPIPDLPKRR